MVEIPKDREYALDIVWGAIRNENQGWKRVFGGYIGVTVRRVSENLGWSQSTTRRLMEYLVAIGQVTKTWDHQHQTYWCGHYSTLNEELPSEPALVADDGDIPF